MQIDHDPDEPPPDTSRSPWGLALIMLVVVWVGSLLYFDLDWHSVGLGALTAGIFVAWAIEVTGNKVPASWRGKPPRR